MVSLQVSFLPRSTDKNFKIQKTIKRLRSAQKGKSGFQGKPKDLISSCLLCCCCASLKGNIQTTAVIVDILLVLNLIIIS